MKIKKISKVKKQIEKQKINKKRGSELAQTILITGVMVVLIATLFFPQIQNLTSSAMTKMSGWFNTVLNSL